MVKLSRLQVNLVHYGKLYHDIAVLRNNTVRVAFGGLDVCLAAYYSSGHVACLRWLVSLLN